MGCIVWYSAVIAWREDATGRNVVLAGPKSISTPKAVEVFIVACMCLVIVNYVFMLRQMNQQSTHVRQYTKTCARWSRSTDQSESVV
jgi:hypothetical protein